MLRARASHSFGVASSKAARERSKVDRLLLKAMATARRRRKYPATKTHFCKRDEDNAFHDPPSCLSTHFFRNFRSQISHMKMERQPQWLSLMVDRWCEVDKGPRPSVAAPTPLRTHALLPLISPGFEFRQSTKTLSLAVLRDSGPGDKAQFVRLH